jgi:NAD(P)-dependent dehydrogenase (short-subunit alcohol dehydrogenase family)
MDHRKLFDLAGKTAIVLGAASGIGKSSAEALDTTGQMRPAQRQPTKSQVTCDGREIAGASRFCEA